MASPVYRIKTRRPLLWRTPHSLQVGVDPPQIVLDEVPLSAAPMIHALHEGVKAEGIEVLARSLRVPPLQIWNMVEQLSGSFDPDTPPMNPRFGITGSSRALAEMARVLRGLGCDVTVGEHPRDALDHQLDGLILVADYLAHPDWVSTLTRLRTPHTPVVFSDRTIEVGPVIRPGITPCLSCREGYLRSRDPHWLHLGSQLWNQTSPLSNPRGAWQAALATAVLLAIPDFASIMPRLSAPGMVLRLNPESFELSHHELPFDPECHCRGL